MFMDMLAMFAPPETWTVTFGCSVYRKFLIWFLEKTDYCGVVLLEPVGLI